MEKVLIIVGPTASGKSALGVEIARRFNGEVISADSRQVYRRLNIGTGKITKREMRGVPHHLLNVASPKRKFSASDFVRHASKAYSSVLQNTRIAILVGGTGYYIDAFAGRITLPEVPPNLQLRKKLDRKTAAHLYSLLKQRDPRRAKQMTTPSERNNKRRLIRALEIVESFGYVPMFDLRGRTFDALWIGINPGLKQLEQKIQKRLLARIKIGMVAEAKKLHTQGLSYRRMEELGLEYRSLARFLQGKISKQEMIDELHRDIRRYAKKQLAYWKRNKEIQWFKPSEKQKIKKVVQMWLKK
ncbi:MAG: tRNA dimethylallyltransferase [Candidatus Kaiserbacteria bacterium GW2011_GWC2_52_8b]|uniref:tRNA dimethylallyltransferase n=2 Tax=Candidatus Kaiseribacteriota TaxID=1752734 RepID=A0A0G1XFA9_9BACT|nr:MAG: tRNA dimethylallyltransferase [Candidatus Kaiserbacteria bacterium GW2011_GWC2_52_8b]